MFLKFLAKTKKTPKTKFEQTTPNKSRKINLLIVFDEILNQNQFSNTKFELSEPSATQNHPKLGSQQHGDDLVIQITKTY